jgi:ABC-type transport system involved in cytochrome c biogenesis permease component
MTPGAQMNLPSRKRLWAGTAVLGAVLLTGYLGGAVATHVRVGDPLFSHVLFPVYVGVLIWGGLYLRDDRLRNFIAPRG